VRLYHEEHGSGEPLVMLHGGIGASETLAPLVPGLDRRVILADLQGHGRTPDADRPLRPAVMADDVAELASKLGLEQIDLFGYSLGGEVALRVAIQHPGLVRRLVLVSIAVRRDGNHAGVLAAFDSLTEAAAEPMEQSPAYAHYSRVAPRPEDWPVLVGKTGDLLREEYDWSDEIAAVRARTLLVYADADSVRPDHAVEFYGLLGGGLGDPGWNGSHPGAQLAVLPGRTHYDVLESPLLVPAVEAFLNS
jgi:pimeloyl-ACP methyl ester carboxylesterase